MQFVNRETVLYGSVAFMGLLTIGYFGLEYIASLSPFTISFVLFSAFAGLLALGLNRSGNIESLSYILSVGAYIIGLGFTIGTFEFSSTMVQFSLLISTVLFGIMAYGITQKELELDFKHLQGVLAVILLLVIGLVGFDVATQEINLDLEIENETVEYQESMNIGTFHVEKPGFLPRNRESVSVNTCLFNSTGQLAGGPNWFEGSEMLGFGHVEQEFDVVLSVRPSEDDGFEEGTEIPVETVEECSESRDGAVLEVATSEDYSFSGDVPDH